ncbi:ABC transporter permease [Afifella sp. IM 167]|uniref:ABC transporter permease n=1 Tax=Afifella sp. IM 167 TaxID=2033586 RepID=UPI001CCABABD|nr:ABC transporter permease subunit [Afifella sp. IM 167]MBZ8133678.1 ABC transporter permease [Afifella sp. IM 167]
MTDGRPKRLALAAPAGAFLLIFLAWPLAGIVKEALADGGGAFSRVFSDPVFWRGVRGSAILGTLAPAVSTVIGLGVSLHLARLSPARRATLLTIIAVPLSFSGLVVAYGFILVFGRAGFVTMLLAEIGADPAFVGGLIYTPAGLAIAYCYYLIPRAVLVILPVVVNFEREQLAAARALGASPLRAFADIALPQLMPACLVAFALCAAVALGAYGTALALSGTQIAILPMVLYSKISDTGSDLPAAAVMSLVLIALASAVMAMAELLRPRLRKNA